MRTKALSIVVALALATLSTTVRAEEIRSVDEIVSRYTEALGGLEKVRALESVRKTGTYVYNGLEHPVEIVQARGSRCREEIVGLTQWGTRNESGAKVIRATDGETAWVGSHSDALRTEPMPEDEATGFRLDADLEGPLVDYGEKGHRVELVGPAEVEGADVLHLTVTLAGGEVQQWYLDRGTFLPVMRSMEVGPRDYKAAQTWFFDDYREVGGVKMPFYAQIEEKLFTREYIFDAIEANVAVEDTVFIRPEGAQVEEES
jgi:outer membrane lipoprotein-sorting protein